MGCLPLRRLSALTLALATVLVLAIPQISCGGGQAGSSVLPPPSPATEPVLLFVGTGTSSSDVSAVEAVLKTLGLGYSQAGSAQLNAMSEQQLGGYKLIIVPGGNSITIGENLSPATASAIRGAVQGYGVHYLGICAGAFFGGYSEYNGVDLTGGVPFDFFADEFKGLHVEPVTLAFPAGASLDVYWEDGPQLSGWGSMVAKYPDSTPAIVEGLSGKGFVMFTGVHLEAPESWRGSMVFNTPASVDQAYAATLFQAALSGTPLPHF